MTGTLAARVIGELIRRGETLAVAESLTGGALASALIAIPGASGTVLGAVVAYQTPLKASLLRVPAALLAERGPVDPEVAALMAEGVRHHCAVDGRPAGIGLSTTGVAGPDAQHGHPVGEVYLGLALEGRAAHRRLELTGDRDAIRAASVDAAVQWLAEELGVPERLDDRASDSQE